MLCVVCNDYVKKSRDVLVLHVINCLASAGARTLRYHIAINHNWAFEMIKVIGHFGVCFSMFMEAIPNATWNMEMSFLYEMSFI